MSVGGSGSTQPAPSPAWVPCYRRGHGEAPPNAGERQPLGGEALAVSWYRRLVQEPLLHFAVIGALLFAIDGRWGSAPAHERRLEVSQDQRSALAADWERTQKRPPSEVELDEAVQRWVEDEILYREGLMRGLDRDDPRIRERVISKMARLLREGIVVPEPTEQELRAMFETQPERFRRESLLDFTQVYVAGTDDAALMRANELLASLRAGSDPAGLGDTFQAGRRFRRRKLADLAAAFGEEFIVGLDTQAEHSWERRRSKLGYHLVRVDGRTAGEHATFESSRLDVEKLWRDEQRDQGVRRALEELRSRWSVSLP